MITWFCPLWMIFLIQYTQQSQQIHENTVQGSSRHLGKHKRDEMISIDDKLQKCDEILPNFRVVLNNLKDCKKLVAQLMKEESPYLRHYMLKYFYDFILTNPFVSEKRLERFDLLNAGKEQWEEMVNRLHISESSQKILFPLYHYVTAYDEEMFITSPSLMTLQFQPNDRKLLFHSIQYLRERILLLRFPPSSEVNDWNRFKSSVNTDFRMKHCAMSTKRYIELAFVEVLLLRIYQMSQVESNRLTIEVMIKGIEALADIAKFGTPQLNKEYAEMMTTEDGELKQLLQLKNEAGMTLTKRMEELNKLMEKIKGESRYRSYLRPFKVLKEELFPYRFLVLAWLQHNIITVEKLLRSHVNADIQKVYTEALELRNIMLRPFRMSDIEEVNQNHFKKLLTLDHGLSSVNVYEGMFRQT